MAAIDVLGDIAPEFTDAEKNARFIGYAETELNLPSWGDKADMATALLAAHLLTIAARKGSNQGAVTGERVGDLGRNYAAPSQNGPASDEPYKATSYGVEFLRLRGTVIAGPLLL